MKGSSMDIDFEVLNKRETSKGSKKPPASYIIPPTEGPKISANPNEAYKYKFAKTQEPF